MRSALLLVAAACASAPAAPMEPAADASPTVLSESQRARDAALAPKAAAFVDAFTNFAPWPLRDGRLLFSSTRDGIPSLYLADANAPSAPPKRLLAITERVGGYSVLPGERAALFLSDVKSDENFSIFHADLDTGAVEELTAGAKLHRYTPIVARRKGGLFAYSAHAQADGNARLFVQVAGAPREVFRDSFRGFLGDLSPDGDRLLYVRFISQNEQVLFFVDAASGKAARAYPPEGAARLSTGGFNAEGDGIYVARQDPGRPARLLLLDAQTMVERAHHEESALPAATVAELAVSPAGDRVAFVVDAGNHSELRIADARTLRLACTAKLGLGTTSGMRFRADGALLAVSFSGPERPRDVVAIAPATCEATPLREDARPAGLSRPTAHIEEIRAFDGLTIPLNVYLPASGAARLPTLVLIHGGPSSSAKIGFTATVAFFTAMGFAVVEPNIRGSTGFGIEFERADDRE